MVGSGIGAAVGTSINTRDHRDDGYREVRRDDRRYREEHHHYHNSNSNSFCPPGQAKKGRC
ncbi:hypothetical protein [Marinobacterium aestuariivivens]|uniref:Glycine zipper domain-containing protein n=1 Tax=Marinobacterium aestuariivivens TaxID=1698799 RepID=A0ABW2A365_9GAMM